MTSLLCVDDEPALLEIIRLYLERSGQFTVEISTSGASALEILKTRYYDAIVSDYQMPGMDGIALLKAVREQHGDIPFILFTGRGREEIVIQAINYGVDFYIQKGGDPKAQFAELAHKIRQAVTRRRAELSLIESEKRLFDIINFLPDATFAIDRSGRVIAWNRAIEDMTGISASEMLGKGDYEYAIPFYGTRRPVLIDLIFEPDDVIAQTYTHIIHDKDVLIANTTLPRPKGAQATLMGKASPLYDREGKIVGAIESIRDITGMKKAEEELKAAYGQLAASEEELRSQFEELALSEKRIRESEEKYRNLAENTADILFSLDNKGTITYVSPQITRVGFSPEDLVTTNFLPLIHPEDRERIFTTFQGEMTTGNNIASTFRMIDKSGLTHWVEEKSNILFDEQKRPRGLQGIIRDITDRKNAEDALRESEMRFRSLFERSAEPQLLLDSNGNVSDCNDAFLALFALSNRNVVIGHGPEEFAPPVQPDGTPSSERGEEILREVIRNGSARFEWAHQKHDAAHTQILTELLCTLIRIAGQPMIHVAIRDITDRKMAQDALQKSEQNYRGVIENLQDVFYRADAAGNITMASPSVADIFGYSSIDEVIGLNLARDFYTDQENRLKFLDEMKKTGSVKNFEAVLKKKDGSPIIISTSAHYYCDPDGNVLGIEGIAKDITEWKHTEEALREREAALFSIFCAAPIGIGLVAHRVILRVNDRLCEMTGYTAEELEGKSVRVLYPTDEDFEYVGEEKYEQIGKYGTGTVETRWQCKDGTLRDILISSTPLDPDDHAKGVTLTALDITERMRVEEALRESEAKFRAIIDQSFEFIGLMTLDGILIEANRAALEFAGISASYVINRPFWETPWWSHSADLQERLKEGIQRAASGETVRFEVTHPAADGHIAYIDFSIKPVVDSTGKILYLIPEGRDITERKHAEEALRESEEKYRTVVEQSQDGIFIAQEGLLVFHNTAFATLTGYQSDELDTRSIADLIAHEDRELVLTRHQERLKGKTLPEVYEFSVLHHDGKSRIPVKMAIAAATFGGKPATIGTLHNVMEDRKRESILRESEERYRSVIENIHEGFVRGDKEGRLTMASPSAARMLGYSTVDEMIGIPMNSIYRSPENRQAMLDQMRKQNGVDEYEIEFVRKDGSHFWGSLDAHLLIHENGGVWGTEAVIRDITERKNMESAIREANRKLNLLNSITRHDVANQLTILQGFIQIAVMNNPDPVMAHYLARIEATAIAISQQIEFTGAYQELGVHAPAWYHIGEIVEKTRLPQVKLSDTCSSYEVFADPMLERVFFNLFDNAVRHGGGVTEIIVRCESSAGALVIMVEDNGKGITADEKEKIFLRGYGKNKGFGLFLVKEILAITGISIQEIGVPGRGARFEILVPEGLFRTVPQTISGSQG